MTRQEQSEIWESLTSKLGRCPTKTEFAKGLGVTREWGRQLVSMLGLTASDGWVHRANTAAPNKAQALSKYQELTTRLSRPPTVLELVNSLNLKPSVTKYVSMGWKFTHARSHLISRVPRLLEAHKLISNTVDRNPTNAELSRVANINPPSVGRITKRWGIPVIDGTKLSPPLRGQFMHKVHNP